MIADVKKHLEQLENEVYWFKYFLDTIENESHHWEKYARQLIVEREALKAELNAYKAGVTK